MAIGQLNPIRFSGAQSGANVSAGDVAKLAQMATQNLSGAISQIDEYGKGKRSEAVANLLGSDQAKQMSSQELAGAVQKLTGGGSVAPEVMDAADLLFKSKAGNELQATKDASAMEQLLIGEEGATERSKIAADTQRQEGMLNRDNALDVAQINANAKLASEKIKLSMKETGLSKVGAKQIEKDIAEGKIPIDKQYQELEAYISDNEDIFFDRELEPNAKRMVRTKLMEYLSTPEGQAVYAVGGPAESWNVVKASMDKGGVTFEDTFKWSNILPFGDSPWRREIKQK